MTEEARPRILTRLIPIGVILVCVLVTGFAFARSLDIDLVSFDMLIHLDYVQSHKPLEAFLPGHDAEALYRAQLDCCVYRPLFVVQMWAFYKLFGLNHSAYQLVYLAVHVLGTLIVYRLLTTLDLSPAWSLLLALTFAVHHVLREPVIWIPDTYIWLYPLAGILLLMLRRPTTSALYHVALTLLLILAPLLRENGLVLPLSVIPCAWLMHRSTQINRRVFRLVTLDALIAGGVYFALRIPLAGLIPAVSADAASPLSYVAAILSNLTATFFPIFDYTGRIETQRVIASILFIIAAVGLLLAVTRWPDWSIRQRVTVVGGTTLAAIITLLILTTLFLQGPLSARHLVILADLIRFAAQSALSAGLLIVLFRHIRDWPASHQSLGLFAACLILFSAGLAFVYFRYRSLMLAQYGWLLLIALALLNLPVSRLFRTARYGTLLLLLTMLILNATFIRASLPWDIWTVEAYEASGLCNPVISESIARDVAAGYGISESDLAACRAARLP